MFEILEKIVNPNLGDLLAFPSKEKTCFRYASFQLTINGSSIIKRHRFLLLNDNDSKRLLSSLFFQKQKNVI